MRITHVFAGVAVSDPRVAYDWYERLLDSPPDGFPKEGEAIWNPTPSASIYITTDPERAGHSLLTMAITNLDHQHVSLARRGLLVREDAEANGMRTLVVTDPDGNTIKFFEDPAATVASIDIGAPPTK